MANIAGIPGDSRYRVLSRCYIILVEVSTENGHEAVLAGNRLSHEYHSLPRALYAIQEHMVKFTDPPRQNGPIIHPDDPVASNLPKTQCLGE